MTTHLACGFDDFQPTEQVCLRKGFSSKDLKQSLRPETQKTVEKIATHLERTLHLQQRREPTSLNFGLQMM
ncbi:jg27754 [Pararge aegeria aegeria]|uniref:Jg27754 protein n=1 Tax=Pararge aegeria aegeria TaxID=348720 RepID=A0A8S4QHM1_9NEOP|nr:jg27754 [Pararge aegeria aegeria]